MPTTVEVPNIGMVEFPNSMQPGEIQAVLQKGVKPPTYGVPGTQVNTPQVAQPAPIAPSPLVSQSESYIKAGDPRIPNIPYDPNALGPIVSQIGNLLNIHPSIPEPSKETAAKWSPTTQRIVGGALGIGEGVASQLTPANAGLVLTGAGLLKAYPAIAPLIKGALPMLFGASMVKQGAQQLGEVAGTPSNQTTPLEQAKKVGEGVTTVGLGALGVAEPGVAEIKKPEISITKEPVVSPEQLARIKAAQPQYQQVDTTPKAKQIPTQVAQQEIITSEKQIQLQTLQTLKPALKEDTGKVIEGSQGQTHADILQSAAKTGELNDVLAVHGFVDDKGNFFNRRQASDLIGQVEPLQSEKLNELQSLNKPEVKPIDVSKQVPQQFPAEKRAIAQLNLTKPSTAGDVARHIAERGDATTQQKEFASFLDRHFSHILDFAGVEPGSNPYGGRAAYIYSGPDSHKIYMDLKENGYNAVDTFLHEAAHAAMHWVYENPATSEQRLAKADIDKLMGLTVDSLPKAVKEFYNGMFQKELVKNPQMSFDKIQTMFEAHGLDIHKWYTTLYALQDGSEFIAGVFGDHRFREFLDNIRVENKDSIFRRIYSAIMSALGIKPGTALEKSFDTFMQMGEGSRERLPGQLDQVRKRFVGEVGVKNMPQLPSEDKGGLPAEDVIWLGDSLFTDMKGPKTWREGVKQKLNQIAGVTAPKTMASSKEAGNALVRYASARIAAPLMAKAAVSEVAGEHWNDQQWLNRFGAVLVEDRLRAIRDTFIENDEKDKAAAVRHIWEQEDSPIKTDAEFKAALKDPEVQAALQRFEKIIGQPTLERQKQLGGKIAASGPESGAFVNLRALQDAEGENIADYALSGGSKKGDLTNPLKRGSVFNKEAKGTARKYDFNFRSIAERMVQGNYEESTKRDLYDTYVKAGLSRAEPAEGFQKITIDKGRGRTENRYFRHDIAGELRQALQTDSPIEKGAQQFLINRLTDVQLAGPVDVTVHIRNIFSAIAGSQGGGESVLADLARKVPGIRGLDTMVRLAKATKDTYLNTPEVQKELAKITEIGAGRGEVKHVGALGRILPTGKIVQVLDKAGRLTLSRMYDNLVERGWAKESEEGRREFVNKMGQYNSRLMGRVEQWLKETSTSPFIVAGKNFNRLALQRLTLNPGVEAANPSAALKMKLVDAVGLVSTLMAIPMAFNYYNTGSIWGRPGIHPGAVDLGKDDEKGRPKQLDLVQNILVRRGLRNVGAEAAFKDMKQGRAESDIIHDAIMDMARGYASPYEGPGVRFAATALTGRDTSGYLVSENPDSLGANLLAALKSANPSIAKLFQAKAEGTSKTSAIASPLIQATGYSVGRKPSLFEQEQQVPGLEKQSLRERAATQKTFQKQDRTEMSQQQKLELSMDEAKRAKQVEASVNKDLKPETRDWLKKQHLEVPGFAEYLTQTGVRVYLLPKERERYMGIMLSSYEDAIRKAKPFVERQTTQEMKEKVLQGFIKSAHGVARNKMRNLIGREE